MPRRKIVAGNWKMNKLPNEAMDFITKISECANSAKCDVILCVPYIDLFYSLLTAQGTKIKIGAQNMHWEEKGAYTGEISGEMLKCINVEYVIIGHSERRMYFAETDETVNKKVKSAFKYALKPIICVGETLEQKNDGKTNEIITNQTKLALEGLDSEQVKNVIIAYEPIWAIGTGKTATSEDANNSIKQIRNKIKEIYGEDISNQVAILYGGSVNNSNAKELFETSDIDGALIGGASLDANEFENIIRAI
jgi:triosephosphate isomerase